MKVDNQIDLLVETEYIEKVHYDSIIDDISKIIGTLVNIINSTKKNNV